MKIYLLLGHTDPATLSGAFADTYEAAARKAGHEVKRQNISEMHFDPILHEGYKTMQALEPDLEDFQANIRWAEHIVIVYPIWWSGMPANLKGLFDRAWLPGFGFKFSENGLTWKKLLKGRTARIIAPANTPPWLLRFMYGSPFAPLSMATLRFSGVHARTTLFGPSERASDKAKAKWFRTVESLARRGK